MSNIGLPRIVVELDPELKESYDKICRNTFTDKSKKTRELINEFVCSHKELALEKQKPKVRRRPRN